MTKHSYPTDLKVVKDASQKVLNLVKEYIDDEKVLFDMKLCFEEAFVNAIEHGNKLDPKLTVDVEVIKNNGMIEIGIYDQGEGFDPNQCANPTKEENLTKTLGRGVFLMKELMDDMTYEKKSRCLWIKKVIS